VSHTRLKLAAAFAGLVALVVLASAGISMRRLRERQIGQLGVRLTAEARLLGELVAQVGGLHEATPELDHLARRASARLSARVTLISADGTVLADSEIPRKRLAQVENHALRAEVAAALGGRVGSDTRRSRTLGRPFLYVGTPAPGGGAVRVAMDLARVDAQVATLRREVFLAGAFGIALAVVAAYLLAGRVLQPLRELGRAAESFLPEDVPPEPLRGRDEIGALASDLAAMGTALRRRLVEVSEEKERLGAVLHAMVEGVLVLDAKGRIVLANRRLRELFGAWGALEGRRTLEVIRRPEVEDGLLRAAEVGEPVTHEIRLDDPPRFVEMHAVRFPATGTLQGTAAVFHDQTEVRRLETVRKEFVANVSHELKTPLTAIRGFAETLQTPLDEAQRAKYLGIILRHAQRLASLIDDLLELSRIEGRREPVRLVELHLGEVVRAVLADMGPRFEAHDQRAERVQEGDDRALADRRGVEQVLLNLLENAAKYSDPGTPIEVRVHPEGAWVQVDVCDEGMGIPDADQARIFERFYRVDKARSRDLGGTGLGLAIVKHLVQAMHGEVFLASCEGEGSRFSFRLPRA